MRHAVVRSPLPSWPVFTFRGSLVLPVFRGSVHPVEFLRRLGSPPLETLAGPQGPPRGYKLHCSLVLAATIKVFNGIPFQLLRIPRSFAFSITVKLSFFLDKNSFSQRSILKTLSSSNFAFGTFLVRRQGVRAF